MPEVLTQVQRSDLRDLELDKRVALALGFKPTITWAIFNADETALMIDFERKAEAIKWWDEHPSVHAEHHIGELEQYEPYSSSIEAAMRVVEKMRAQGWSFASTLYEGELPYASFCKRTAVSSRNAEAQSLPEANLSGSTKGSGE